MDGIGAGIVSCRCVLPAIGREINANGSKFIDSEEQIYAFSRPSRESVLIVFREFPATFCKGTESRAKGWKSVLGLPVDIALDSIRQLIVIGALTIRKR